MTAIQSVQCSFPFLQIKVPAFSDLDVTRPLFFSKAGTQTGGEVAKELLGSDHSLLLAHDVTALGGGVIQQLLLSQPFLLVRPVAKESKDGGNLTCTHRTSHFECCHQCVQLVRNDSSSKRPS
jgi:hypothetical protein